MKRHWPIFVLLLAILSLSKLAVPQSTITGGGSGAASGITLTSWYPGFVPTSGVNVAASGSADQIKTEGFNIPANTTVTVTNVVFFVGTADGVNNSDFGLYNSSGTQLCHVGAATYAGTGQKSLACSASLTGGKYYFAICSHATTLALNGSASNLYPMQLTASATSCNNGALPASVTIPADASGFNTVSLVTN